jgi:myo-inositol 2-dehydrogenase / D-chiro-inositol 1-dehydrogenase
MSERQVESRRGFLRGSAATIAGAAMVGGVNLTVARMAHAQGSDLLKVALIGCGGRGNGAVRDHADRRDGEHQAGRRGRRVRGPGRRNRPALARQREFKDRVDLPDDRVFSGLDAYKKAIDSGSIW